MQAATSKPARTALIRRAHSTTTNAPNPSLTLQSVEGEPRIDSRLLALQLANQHESIVELLTAYSHDFRELGIFRFRLSPFPGGSSCGRPEKYAMLNEDQAYLLLTYSRNTPMVRALKVRLVKAFREAHQARDLIRTEYLPSYHALHGEIHALARHSPNRKFVHMNVNRLINKTVGIGSGERERLDVPHRAILIAAQFVARTAMYGATDHKEGYAYVKQALERFGIALLGNVHTRQVREQCGPARSIWSQVAPALQHGETNMGG